MTNLDEPTHGEYDGAVQIIKAAILRSQYAAARSVNEEQLKLYFGIGKYISLNSRKGFWGKGAIDAISEQLQRELPGLRGFSARNLRNMRTFYEEWSMLDSSSHAIDMQLWAPEGANIGGGGSNLAVETAKIGRISFRGVSKNRFYAAYRRAHQSKIIAETPFLHKAERRTRLLRRRA